MRVSAIHDSLTSGYDENCPSLAVSGLHVATCHVSPPWLSGEGCVGGQTCSLLLLCCSAAHLVAHFNYTAHCCHRCCCKQHSQFIAFKLIFRGILDFRMDGGSATEMIRGQAVGWMMIYYLPPRDNW